MRKKLLVTAVIVVVALGAGVAGAQVQQRFNDVPTDHYAYEAVNWAVAAGITVGCGDGTNFCPERNLNRAHMVTFLKRYHDWLSSGPLPTPPDAPPKYPTYEAAVTAANTWYEEMVAIIGGGARAEDWNEVTQNLVDKASLWAGHDLVADRLVSEASLMSRVGDPIISRQGDLKAARFYTAVVGYALASSAAAAAQDSDAEPDAASAAAWSAVGARLSELAHNRIEYSHDRIFCSGCVIGGFDRFNYDSGGFFIWDIPAVRKSGEARNAYFELAS